MRLKKSKDLPCYRDVIPRARNGHDYVDHLAFVCTIVPQNIQDTPLALDLFNHVQTNDAKGFLPSPLR